MRAALIQARGFDQTMTQRTVAPQKHGLPPKYIADYQYTKVTGLADTYVDYYVSATDNRGNTYNSPIRHVYVSPAPTGGGGSTNGCNGRVCVSPAPPVAVNPVTISFNPSGGPLAGAGAVKIHPAGKLGNCVDRCVDDVQRLFESLGVHDYRHQHRTQLDCVFNNGANTWTTTAARIGTSRSPTRRSRLQLR